MTRSIYLLGAPAAGKTATAAALIDRLGLHAGPDVQICGLLRARPLADDAGRLAGWVLGRHRPPFSGTDALGMSVHPHAMRWVAETPASELGAYIIGEGARLGTGRFLAALGARTPLTIALLEADPHTLDQRCRARGSNQSPAWRRGAETRAARAFRSASAAAARTLRIDTTRHSPEQVAALIVATDATGPD